MNKLFLLIIIGTLIGCQGYSDKNCNEFLNKWTNNFQKQEDFLFHKNFYETYGSMKNIRNKIKENNLTKMDTYIIDHYKFLILNDSITFNDKKVIEYLLKKGVSPFKKTEKTDAAISFIVQKKDIELLKLVEKYYSKNHRDDILSTYKYMKNCNGRLMKN